MAMAQFGIKCYRCEKHQEFQTYIELRSHLERVHDASCHYNYTKGDEKQRADASRKEEYDRANMEMKLENSERTVTTLMENLETKEQLAGKLQEDLWIMTKTKKKLERKYEENCNKIEEIKMKHEKEDIEKHRKALLKINKMEKMVEELRNEKEKMLEENNQMRTKVEKMVKEGREGRDLVNKEQYELARKYAQECHEKLKDVEKIMVNQSVEIEELNEFGDDAKQIIQNLEEEIIYLSKENMDFKEKNKELKELVTKKEEHMKQLRNLKEEQDKIAVNLKEKNQCLTKKISEMGEELGKASLDMKRMKYELDCEQQKCNRYESETNGLQAELGELKMMIKMKDVREEEYEGRLDFMNTELKILQSKISNDNESIIMQKRIKEILDIHYLNLQRHPNEGVHWMSRTNDVGRGMKEQKMMEVEHDNYGVNEKLIVKEKEKRRLKERVDQLEKELRNANEISHRRKYELEMADTLKKEIDDQIKKTKQYEKENEDLKRSLHKLQIQLMQNHEEHARVQNNKEKGKEECDRMRRKCEQYSRQNYQLLEMINELRTKNRRLVDELEMMRDAKVQEKDEELPRERKINIARKKSLKEEKIAKENLGYNELEITENYEPRGGRCSEFDDEIKKMEVGGEVEKGQGSDIEEKEAESTIHSIDSIDQDEQEDYEIQTKLQYLELNETEEETPDKMSESLESLEFKYLEAKIEFENHKAQIAAATNENARKKEIGGINTDISKERMALFKSMRASNDAMSRVPSHDISSPLPSCDFITAFQRKRSSRFENVDSETGDEIKQRSKMLFSKKELEIIAEDAINSELTEVESEIRSCPEIDEENSADNESFVIHGNNKHSYDKGIYIASLDERSKDSKAPTELNIKRGHSFASESGNNPVDSRHKKDVAVKNENTGMQSTLTYGPSSMSVTSTHATDSLTCGYLQALGNITDEDMLVQEEGIGRQTLKHLSDSRLNDVMPEIDFAPRRNTYHGNIVDCLVHGELGNTSENRNCEFETNRPAELCHESKLEQTGDVKNKERGEAITVDKNIYDDDYDDTGRKAYEDGILTENKAAQSCSLNKIKSNHGTNSNSDHENNDIGPSEHLNYYKGRRHSLAYELLRRKNLDYDFKQEYKAKETMQRSSTRRISSGEVDAQKLRQKAKESTKSQNNLANQNDSFNYAGQTAARIGWFQIAASREKLIKNRNTTDEQDSDFDMEEITDNKVEESHKQKSVKTDNGDSSIYSDSNDSDSSNSELSDSDSSDSNSDDFESLLGNLDANSYYQRLLNRGTDNELTTSSSVTRSDSKDGKEDLIVDPSAEDGTKNNGIVTKQQYENQEQTDEKIRRAEASITDSKE